MRSERGSEQLHFPMAAISHTRSFLTMPPIHIFAAKLRLFLTPAAKSGDRNSMRTETLIIGGATIRSPRLLRRS